MAAEGRLFRSAPTAEAHPGTLGGGALAARTCLPPAGHFSPRKSAENAPGAAAPGPPVGPRGVHPRKRHCPGRYAPPGCPVPYHPPLPGFARASRIGQSLRLLWFSQRPHGLPRNRGGYGTRQHFTHSLHVRRRGAHRASVPL